MPEEGSPEAAGRHEAAGGRRPKAAPKKRRPHGRRRRRRAGEEATLVAAEPAEAVTSRRRGAARLRRRPDRRHRRPPAGKNVLTSQRAPRLRRWLALILVVMAVVGLVVSALALWSDSLVFNTDKWVATVAPVAEDPAVRHSVSTFVADKTLEVADLQDRIAKALPSDAAVLAQPLTQTLREFLIKEIDKFLATPTAQNIWVDVNRFAHEQLITALQDKNRYVSVNQNDVTSTSCRSSGWRCSASKRRSPGSSARTCNYRGSTPRPPRPDPHAPSGRHGQVTAGRLRHRHSSQGRPRPRGQAGAQPVPHAGHRHLRGHRLLILAALLVSPRKRWTALELGLGVLLAVVVVRVAERQLEQRIVAALKDTGRCP